MDGRETSIGKMATRRRFFLLGTGLFFLVMSVIVPAVTQLGKAEILDPVWMAEVSKARNPMFFSSFLAVLLNVIQNLPICIGVFLLSEFFVPFLAIRWHSAFLSCALLAATYFTVHFFSTLQPHVEVSTLIVLTGVILLNWLKNETVGIGAKALVLIQLLLAIEWLKLVGWLTPYGFGLDKISLKIKKLAEVYGVHSDLNMLALFLCCFLLITAGISFLFSKMLNYMEQEQKRMQQVKVKMAKARAGQEVLFLVHDLKTPLTSIGGLNELIGLRSDDEKVKLYSQKVEQSISLMNEMISEILFEDKRKNVSVKEIMDSVVSERLIGSEISFSINLRGQNRLLFVNKTRVVRALINLLANANDAIAGQAEGSVTIIVEDTKSEVHFSVVDNGKGIKADEMHRLWDLGYSTKDSVGAGLAFVKQVVQANGGQVVVRSKEGEGTVFTLILPWSDQKYGESAHSG